MNTNPFLELHLHLKHQDNGDLIWISKKRGRAQFSVAGTICLAKNDKNLPCIRVKYCGVIYQATHLIIWLRKSVILSDNQIIDHIDGNPLNNKIENLRVCDFVINNKNKKMQKNNASGITGVRFNSKENSFIVTLGRGHKYAFKSLLDACCKRKSLELSNGYTKRHGI